MQITMIACPFRTTYGAYVSSLRSGIERATGVPVQWVASNCGCSDSAELARQFEASDCNFFEMRASIAGLNILEYSTNPVKQALKAGIRNASNHRRVARYADLASGADVIHLHQTLSAYGSDVAFRLLRQRLDAARVITVHELGPEQIKYPDLNYTYNLAGAVIVHDRLLKKRLVSMGVAEDLVHVVCCGTDLTEGETVTRDGIVFYGGHHLLQGKGLSVLLQAYRYLKERSRTKLPRLRIHGHYGTTPPQAALEMAKQALVADDVEWLNELPLDDIARLYRRSQVCVLPYSRSFAGLAVGIAAANRLPIIATRVAGIPDHIGDLGIWIGGDDPEELAARIEKVLSDKAMLEDYGARLRAHAEENLGWDAVARATLTIYHRALGRAQEGREMRKAGEALSQSGETQSGQSLYFGKIPISDLLGE